MSKSLKSMLRIPAVYRFSQLLIAPGFQKSIKGQIKSILEELPRGRRLLDVGCGPSSYLWWFDMKPVGLDLSRDYVEAYRKSGGDALLGSCDKIPFPDGFFDGVWSFGLLHHLPDDTARNAVKEMVRVSRRGGYVVIFDAVLPEPAWKRPLAWFIRKCDRGKFMRCQINLESILPDRGSWQCRRVVYTLNGLEGLYCIRRS